MESPKPLRVAGFRVFICQYVSVPTGVSDQGFLFQVFGCMNLTSAASSPIFLCEGGFLMVSRDVLLRSECS